MNLVFGCFWLVGALGLFAYEIATGKVPYRVIGLNVSVGWFMLLFAAWSFARWYSARAGRAEQESLRLIHEARLRQARRRDRPEEPDPTFDFSPKPPDGSAND
jgi:hypothetical protein